MTHIISNIYDRFVRPYLPRKFGTVAGVEVKRPRLLDINTTDPNYEQGIIESLQEFVRPDDKVVILGAGWGVTLVHAARLGGEVLAYEAGDRQIEHAREAVQRNNVANASIKHRLIATDCGVFGGTSAPTLPPDEIPSCDVLEIDIEGAEFEVLQSLTVSPRVIIVECHEPASPEEEVRQSLVDHGYRIVDESVESSDGSVVVLTAVKEDVEKQP